MNKKFITITTAALIKEVKEFPRYMQDVINTLYGYQALILKF
jgi:hypothetical protein